MSVVSRAVITVEQQVVTRLGEARARQAGKAAEQAIRATQKKNGLVVDALTITVKEEPAPVRCWGAKLRGPRFTFEATGKTKTPMGNTGGIWGQAKNWFGDIVTTPLIKAKITLEQIVGGLRDLKPPV